MPEHYYALASLVFMMSFVIIFDRTHWRKKVDQFVTANLLSAEDVARMQRIWCACQEQ
jgi:hypothetical protein